MTSAAFPWWGWLVIAQAGFVYALFEYVRRAFAVANELRRSFEPRALAIDLDERFEQLSQRLTEQSRHIQRAIEAPLSEAAIVTDHLAWQKMAALADDVQRRILEQFEAIDQREKPTEYSGFDGGQNARDGRKRIFDGIMGYDLRLLGIKREAADSLVRKTIGKRRTKHRLCYAVGSDTFETPQEKKAYYLERAPWEGAANLVSGSEKCAQASARTRGCFTISMRKGRENERLSRPL